MIAVWALTVNLTSCGLGSNLNPPTQADDLGAIGDGFGKQGTLIGNGGSNPTTSFGFLQSGDFYCRFNDLSVPEVMLKVTGRNQSNLDELIAQQLTPSGVDFIVPASALTGFEIVTCSAQLPSGQIQVLAEQLDCSRADLNSDQLVDSLDLSVLLANTSYDPQFDINGDGVVSASDISHLLNCMESGGAQ